MPSYLRDFNLKIAESKRTETPRKGQTVSGYGSKLPTSLMIRLEGEKIWRRVLVICWSNAGSAYFTYKGTRIFISDCDLPEENKDG